MLAATLSLLLVVLLVLGLTTWLLSRDDLAALAGLAALVAALSAVVAGWPR